MGWAYSSNVFTHNLSCYILLNEQVVTLVIYKIIFRTFLKSFKQNKKYTKLYLFNNDFTLQLTYM